MAAPTPLVSIRVACFAVGTVGAMALVTLAGWVTVPSSALPPSTEFGGGRAPDLRIQAIADRPEQALLREQLWLMDPAPLFLPVEGAVWSEEPGVRPNSGVVGPIPPALRFPARAPARLLLRPESASSPAATAAQLAEPRWFDGLARGDVGVEKSTGQRVARVELYRSSDAEGNQPLAQYDLRQPRLQGADLWRPMILSVLVNPVGVVAEPIVVLSSGITEVDERIRWIVGRELLPTLLLRPGVYRLEVGP